MPAHLEPLETRRLFAGDLYVSPAGDDANAGTDPALPWRTVQHAADVATAGSTVHVAPGRYREKVAVHVSGDVTAGYITFDGGGSDPTLKFTDATTGGSAGSPANGSADVTGAVIDGKGVAGRHLLDLSGCRYVRVVGFELTNDRNVSDGSGIRIEGKADHVEIRSNRIHKITGRDAMGITVYGTDAAEGVHDLVIDRNEVYDCRPAKSEALTLNGNVHDFSVTNNAVHDHNNIGIVFIGGEKTCPDPALDQARDGVCADNRIWNCRSNYGGGFAAGLYVDGGRDIVLERNRITGCDIGLSVGCENQGRTATGVAVRDNVVYRNRKAGFDIGGYAENTGRVLDCTFTNNTLYQNQTATKKFGEIWIEYATGCTFENNVVVARDKGTLILGEIAEATDNRSDYNQFVGLAARHGPPLFAWQGVDFTGAGYPREGPTLGAYELYSSTTSQDFHSGWGSVQFVSAKDADFRLMFGGVDAGDPNFVQAAGETDAAGGPRKLGAAVDAGAYEMA